MWQKRARAALAVLMVAVAVAVFVCLRNRRVEDAVAPPRRDPNATVQAGPGVFTRTKDGRTIFTLQFQSQLTYGDGRNVFRDVVITFPNREGRTFRVTGREATQVPRPGKELGDVTLDGGVTMTGDDGLKVETASASYDQAASLVRAPGPVTFSRGRTSGSGHRRHVRSGAGRHDPARPGEDHGRAGCRRAGEHGHHGRNRRDGAHGANDPLRAGCHRRRLAAVGVIRHSRRRPRARKKICWIGSSLWATRASRARPKGQRRCEGCEPIASCSTTGRTGDCWNARR